MVNDPLYNHEVFGPLKGRSGDIGGKTDEELVRDLINIHNAENWLGIDGDSDISIFKAIKSDSDVDTLSLGNEMKGEHKTNITLDVSVLNNAWRIIFLIQGHILSDDDLHIISREISPTCPNSPQCVDVATPNDSNGNETVQVKNADSANIINHTVSETNSNIGINEKSGSYSHLKVEVGSS